jgi:hypothetical protein
LYADRWLQIDLGEFIDFGQSECLNARDSEALKAVLGGAGEEASTATRVDVLSSDSDEQLLIKIAYVEHPLSAALHSFSVLLSSSPPACSRFKERVKLQSIEVLGPNQSAPRNVKLFVDKPVRIPPLRGVSRTVRRVLKRCIRGVSPIRT